MVQYPTRCRCLIKFTRDILQDQEMQNATGLFRHATDFSRHALFMLMCIMVYDMQS